MNKMFSPNMIKTYQMCPRKYYYRYLKHINMPQTDKFFEKGKKIHALANYLLRNIKIDKLEKNLTPEEQKNWKKLLNNQYFNKECVNSEFTLYAKIENHWLEGRIDAIVKDNNDNYFILDYKTGMLPKDPDFDPQTMIYLIGADKYIKNYQSLSFVYIDLKENKDLIIKFNDELKNQYCQKLSQICNQILNDSTYKKNTDNCKYCEYSKICKQI